MTYATSLILGRMALMRPTVADEAAQAVCLAVCLSGCLSVSLLVATMSSAKTDEPIENNKVPFGGQSQTLVSARNHALDGANIGAA